MGCLMVGCLRVREGEGEGLTTDQYNSHATSNIERDCLIDLTFVAMFLSLLHQAS